MDISQYSDELKRKNRIITSESCNSIHSNILSNDFKNYEIIPKKSFTSKDILEFAKAKTVMQVNKLFDKIRKRWRKDTLKMEFRTAI